MEGQNDKLIIIQDWSVKTKFKTIWNLNQKNSQSQIFLLSKESPTDSSYFKGTKTPSWNLLQNLNISIHAKGFKRNRIEAQSNQILEAKLNQQDRETNKGALDLDHKNKITDNLVNQINLETMIDPFLFPGQKGKLKI